MSSQAYAQFANLLQAAPTAPKARKGAIIWNIEEILRESDRCPDSSRHVQNPQPPVWLIGSRQEVQKRACAWHAQARRAGDTGRRPKNSPALACAVVSYPRQLLETWNRYRNEVVDYFRRSYGDRLVGVVEHRDERHPHVHVYLVPRPGEDFGQVHPGYKASRQARKADGNHVGVAFRSAMKCWQDSLYENVSQLFGLARLGPRRARLDRLVWTILDKASEQAKRSKSEADAAIEAAKKELDASSLDIQRLQMAVSERDAYSLKRAQALDKRARVMLQKDQEQRELATAIDQQRKLVESHEVSKLLSRIAVLEGQLADMTKALEEERFRHLLLKQRTGNEQGDAGVVRPNHLRAPVNR